MEMNQPLLKDFGKISSEELALRPHASRLTFAEVLPFLASPDTGSALQFDGHGALIEGTESYPLRDSIPILLPKNIQNHFSDRLNVPFEASKNSFLQYFLLSSIKQSGEINAPSSDEHYQRHLFRMKDFLSDCKGSVLDVGCDDPALGASLFPTSVEYIGLDPFCQRLTPFRIVGVGEFLPFLDQSIDNVLFNTSLDHILDWHRAIDEALRVLVSGGTLYICTLIWTKNAELISDSVHFHHFREYEILGGLDQFKIEVVKKYDYKGNSHRFGLFLKAIKK